MTSRKKSDGYGPTRGIIGKVLIAIFLAVGVLAAAVYLTRTTFFDVNEKIETLSRKHPKIDELNRFYSDFERFERDQQVDYLSGSGSDSTYFLAKNNLLYRLDSMKRHLPFTAIENIFIDTIYHHLEEQGQRLMAYRQLRKREKPMLKADLDSVMRLISATSVMIDTSVITTERTLRTLQTPPREDESEQEKKSFFQRLFSGKVEEPDAKDIVPAVVEETNIKIDTLAVEKRDTSAIIAGRLIRNIKREQVYIDELLRNTELNMLRGSAFIQNTIQLLIRNVEGEELEEVQRVSGEAATLMDEAMNRMYIIWAVFAVIAMVLLFAITDDLARARYYRKRLVESKERAEELSHVKEQFLANMSHELRTPLQSILGYAEQLLDDPRHGEEIEVIHRSSEHLLHIVNEILDFSRIDKGHLTLYPENFNLMDEVDSVVQNIEIQARAKGLRILFSKTVDDVVVYADPFRLRQILFNILGNAVKFTEKGFVQLRIDLEDTGEEYRFKFEVEDTGVGMESEELTRIFNEFSRGRGAKYAVTGTGLGLSIVKTLTEAFDGKIEVESRKDEGTIFRGKIRLGYGREVTIEDEDSNPRRKAESVLLVDDDKSILALAERILVKQGIHVETTESPLKALEMINDGYVFDVIMADFRMPEMNGEELRTEIKKTHPDLPVIAMTANIFSAHGGYSGLGEFDGVLRKPFRASELLHMLGYSPDNGKPRISNQDGFVANLDKVTMGDHALAAEIIARFKEDCRGDIENIRVALTENDPENLREMAHRLAGRLGQFHVGPLERFYRATEHKLENGEYSLDNILEDQEKALVRLEEFLESV